MNFIRLSEWLATSPISQTKWWWCHTVKRQAERRLDNVTKQSVGQSDDAKYEFLIIMNVKHTYMSNAMEWTKPDSVKRQCTTLLWQNTTTLTVYWVCCVFAHIIYQHGSTAKNHGNIGTQTQPSLIPVPIRYHGMARLIACALYLITITKITNAKIS